MGVVRKFEVGSREGYLLWCPGCEEVHQIWTKGEKIIWDFDGNEERPTFSPSLLVWVPDSNGGPDRSRCHSYIRTGQWEFLSDCTHALAGQTVPIPEFRTS